MQHAFLNALSFGMGTVFRIVGAKPTGLVLLLSAISAVSAHAGAAELTPAPQKFRQEIATRFGPSDGLPPGKAQLIEIDYRGTPRLFTGGRWFEFQDDGKWRELSELAAKSDREFVVGDASGAVLTLALPWRDMLQVLRWKSTVWVATAADPFLVANGTARSLGWPSKYRINQMAVDANGTLWVASSAGLFRRTERGWSPLGITDGQGRAWAVQDVLGVASDAKNQLWFATRAGVGMRAAEGWKFFEGKDGLPWNDFTGMTAGPEGEIWFGTRLGAIRFDGQRWHYRQGPAWLPDDEVRQIAVDLKGRAWFATGKGAGVIEFKPMTLAEKAAFYEDEIARYIKRTPFGYVAEAPLRTSGDKSTAHPNDSDNDGLWTAMYGAGECFGYAAIGDPAAKARAKQAFEALRFLQKVTQGGAHSPPDGYIARTIRSTDEPDPNAGRIEGDREEQKRDKLWKAYEPRWPKSADGKWYWKSDTSSDELDGHYFFYSLYYEFCADIEEEKERVRDVVRRITDHLIEHGFLLIDHDGKPTRWGIYAPQYLNEDPYWWPERGLNSLSILTYLSDAAHITGDPKYAAASRELIEKHGYAQNIMYPKVQHGPGSGNQSDDEMGFMCYYNLLRYSRDEALKKQVRSSFYGYWANEAPEMNPFFNFSYAAHTLQNSAENVFGRFSLKPWEGWFEDSIATLYGFPLDRVNWSRRNSHRLDLQLLSLEKSTDLSDARRGGRGFRVNGKVLPIENRYFEHWNTDPWRLDYNENGMELGAGTVFLLP
ncbi:MAG TPA: hypothetical protein VGR78_05485, partial [Verrucomicrobiae bacterium]|nr:hypothetical protein [Verrucomicrobiae bacterium]